MAEAAEKVRTPKVAPSAKTLREYETIYLLRQEMTQEQVDRVKERIRGIIDREGGHVVRFTTWGKKKTAFLVGDKQSRAIFVHAAYLGGGRAVSEVERNLRNLEEVLKFQTIKISDAVLPESRPTEEDVVLEGERDEERQPREGRGEDERPRGAGGDDDAERGDEDSEGEDEGSEASED